jgi:hypothetical protein
VQPPLLQAFHFPSTLGEVVLYPPSPAAVFIYSSHGKWHLPSLLWSFPPTATFTSFPAPGFWVMPLLLPSLASLFIYSSRGKWPFPFLLWSFLPTVTFTSFPSSRLLGGCCHSCFLQPACEGFPLPHLRHSGHPALFATCLFYCCLLFSWVFSLFSLGGGWSVQGDMLIWPMVVCGSTTRCLAHPVICFSQASGSVRVLLVSPFNVEWRCYVWCVLEFYLFLVVFPARYISSVSPRFYFRKHAFCFLPLVAILESYWYFPHHIRQFPEVFSIAGSCFPNPAYSPFPSELHKPLLIFFIFVVLEFLECLLYFLVTMSNNFSMKFSLITYRISSFRLFLWASFGSLV